MLATHSTTDELGAVVRSYLPSDAADWYITAIDRRGGERLLDRRLPVITGRTGTDPIFQNAADVDLELIETRTLDGHTQELIYRPTLHRPVDASAGRVTASPPQQGGCRRAASPAAGAPIENRAVIGTPGRTAALPAAVSPRRIRALLARTVPAASTVPASSLSATARRG